MTGQLLADVVRRKGATACSLEGWVWRELKVLPVSWLAFSLRSRIFGFGLRSFWMLTIAMIPETDGDGVTLSRSVELTAQWGRILSIGPLHPTVLGDLRAVDCFGLGDFRRVVGDLHRRLSDFIHGVVVCRRDEAIREWRDWLREDALVHNYKWLRPDLVPPALFLQCKPHRTPGGSGCVC